MDYYRFFPVLYQADTLHLTLAQDGAYRRLIDHYMTSRQPLPDNDAALARIAGCTLSEWAEIAPIIRPFFKPRNSVLSHKRCDAELAWQDNRQKIRSEIAQKGVDARRRKNKGLATNGQPNVNLTSTRGEERRLEENKEVTPLPPKGRTTKTRLMIESLPAEWLAFATANGVREPNAMWDRFRDYWHSEGKAKADWAATWRNWVRRDLSEGRDARKQSDKVSPITAAVGRAIREGRRELCPDVLGGPGLNGIAGQPGMALEPVRTVDAALPPNRRPWGA
jgi:uncharacterized protein YdaU (DUF1376 family)